MAFKFPFTNYHELNLTWVLEQLKKLFEESEENVETIETYDNRLSAVETEVSTLETTTSQAINTANAAATNAATALSRANAANQNALTASSQAGAAVTAAQESQQEAQAATQAAQQAQATAMTFDGRITQAQNDASAAVHEAESFENRVNAAINTANNAANTATIAQGIAVNANQTAAQALDELNAQRDELESIAAGLIDDINNEADAEKQDIQNLADTVIASIPSDYTQLSADVKNKAPVIVANASGDIVSIKDGADDMEIRHLLATINPIQAGTGEPSPTNVRAISGRTSLYGARTGKNLIDGSIRTELSGGYVRFNTTGFLSTKTVTLPAGTYTFSYTLAPTFTSIPHVAVYDSDTSTIIKVVYNTLQISFTLTKTTNVLFQIQQTSLTSADVITAQLEVGSIVTNYEAYQGQTISVNWQTEAGTVYGATLDVVSGEMIVTYEIVEFDGSSDEQWGKGDYENYRIPVSGMPVVPANINGIIACNRLKPIAFNDRGSTTVPCIMCESSVASIELRRLTALNITTVAELRTWLTNNPVSAVYPLASPQTVQLDPVTVKTLLGYNTIYTDCGPVSVDYPADTKLYIDGKFAELQALVLEN